MKQPLNATEQFQARLIGNIFYLTNRGDTALQITVPDNVDVDCVVAKLKADGYRVTPRKGWAKHNTALKNLGRFNAGPTCIWNYLTITWGMKQ